MMEASDILKTLNEACDAAAVETLARFRVGTRVSNKEAGGFDPVTEGDRGAETAIRAVIEKRHPDHSILGEEHGLTGDSPWQWIIDPIDGTRAFISGLPVWGTLIGLYHNGRPVAGVMDQPYTGERYIGLPDGTARLTDRFSTHDLTTSAVTELADATVMTVDPVMLDNPRDGAFFNVTSRAKLVRYGCDCYAYSMVASGHVEAVIESCMNVYDIAALIPIIEQAGGIVTNWQGGDGSQGGQVLACANPTLHARIVETLNA
jgi:histidinol phosphatase-like enzyme (inositol monophosphatase family)